MTTLVQWAGTGLADATITSGNVTAQAGTGDTPAPAAIVGSVVAVASGKLKYDQAASVAAYIRWAHTSVAQGNGIGSFKLAALPASAAVIWQAVGSGSIRYRFAITATGQLQSQKSGGTVLATSTGTITAGTTYYLIHWAVLSTTVGEVHAQVVDSTGAVVAQVDSTAQNLGGNIDALWLGPTTTTPTLGTLTWDDLTITDQSVMPTPPGSGGTTPTPVTGKRVLVIGDSLTYMGNTGDGIIRAALVALGWDTANIAIDGVIGRTLTAADSTGRTALGVLSTYVATYGAPDQLVMALGTNDISHAAATQAADLATVVAGIGSIKTVWIDVGIRADIEAQDTRVSDFNGRLVTAITGHANITRAGWDAYVHNGRDETNPNLWNTGDSTGYHMAPQGWNLRGAYYATSVGAPPAAVVVAATGALRRSRGRIRTPSARSHISVS